MTDNILDIKKLEQSTRLNVFSQRVVNIFLLAINDWPNEVLSFQDYELGVALFVKDSTTESNIKKALSTVNFSNNSWEAESLSQILNVFSFYENGISLKEIIEDLKIKIGKGEE